jgi:hypothetical protein
MPRALPCLCLSLGVTLASPRRAGAAAAEEWELGVRVGYAAAVADGRRPAGVLGGADLLYGLTDAWAARLSLASSIHPVDADVERPGGRVQATAIALGFTYAVDVLRVVPFLEAGVALGFVTGDVRDARRDLGLEAGLGAAYLLTPRWALAALVRYQHFPLRLGGADPIFATTPAILAAGVRLARVF